MCILNLGGQIKASNLKRRNIASRGEEAIARTVQGKSMGGVTSAVHVWHGALACCAEGEGRLMKDQVTAEVRFLAWKTSVLWCDTSLIARLQFCFTCGHRGRISRVQLARKVSHCAVIRINAKLGVKYAATPPLVWMAWCPSEWLQRNESTSTHNKSDTCRTQTFTWFFHTDNLLFWHALLAIMLKNCLCGQHAQEVLHVGLGQMLVGQNDRVQGTYNSVRCMDMSFCTFITLLLPASIITRQYHQLVSLLTFKSRMHHVNIQKFASCLFWSNHQIQQVHNIGVTTATKLSEQLDAKYGADVGAGRSDALNKRQWWRSRLVRDSQQKLTLISQMICLASTRSINRFPLFLMITCCPVIVSLARQTAPYHLPFPASFKSS